MKVMVLIPPSRFAKNVARDLIYGCWCKGKRIAGIQFPPVSQLLVATVLKESGHEATIVDAAVLGMDIDELKREVEKDYQIVIMLTSSMTINEDEKILSELKAAKKGLKSIVYGAQPTFMPVFTALRKGIDFAVQREAEFIIRDLVAALNKDDESWRGINGIAYRENGRVVINGPYPFIEDLDALPFPDRRMLPHKIDYFNPVVKRLPFTTMFTARGCPGRCTYCSSPPFYGRKIRFRSSQSILAELEILQDQGYKEVFFRDEIFTVSKMRTIEVCEGILKRGLDLSWICSARIGSVDLETMRLMKEAGCHMIRFGVESGVQEILDNIQKGITVEQTRQTFEWAHIARMDTHAHSMIGMPGETQQTIDQTIKFIKEIDPTVVTFGICTPYPGTRLFEEVVKRYPEVGDGSECDLRSLHTKGFYNEIFTELTNEELSRYIRRAYRSFYLRPSYLFKWLKRIKSLDELRRVSLAGTQVFDFIFRGE